MNQERWNRFSAREQLLHIGSALLRAAAFEHDDASGFRHALLEADTLSEATLADPKWEPRAYLIRGLKSEIKKFSSGERTDSIKALYDAL